LPLRATAEIQALAVTELTARKTRRGWTPTQVRYKPGNDGGQQQAPSMIERAGKAAGDLLGDAYGTLIYSLLRGVKQGSVSTYLARIVLERAMPDSRPTPVELPPINCAADLVEADRRLMAAANVGAISHTEWRRGQECIAASWEFRKQARLEEP
jgi:hypothetical protein